MIIAARYALAGMLLVAPLLADGAQPDSAKVRPDTLEQKMDSLVSQQNQTRTHLLAIRNLLVKRLSAAEVDTSRMPKQLENADSLVKTADPLLAQRDSVNGSGH